MSAPSHAPSPLTSKELSSLLKATSRSFYITLSLLPAAIRPQIGLAYLLARATDTIADTDAVSVPLRLAALNEMRQSILGTHPSLVSESSFNKTSTTGGSASAEEVELLGKFDRAIRLLDSYPRPDQELIRTVLSTIISGQELDLERFASASCQNIIALASLSEADDYTHRVAGCVGEFWTQSCTRHLFRSGEWNEASQLRDGVRFGCGLQWVNILRDLPRDLRQGRCYLPADELAQAGLNPHQLLEPSSIQSLRPLFDRLLRHASEHLQSGWDYTQAIPSGQKRLRVACAVPLLIGFRTLDLLRKDNPLDPGRRIKVSRSVVRQCLVRSTLASWGMTSWKSLRDWSAPST
jgi:farnesyl-diphosphate farnesyltransferase